MTETPVERRVKRWSKYAREAIEARDKAIREMRSDGATFRRIAEFAGLTHTAVAKIVKRS